MELLDIWNDMATMRKTLSDKRLNAQHVFCSAQQKRAARKRLPAARKIFRVGIFGCPVKPASLSAAIALARRPPDLQCATVVIWTAISARRATSANPVAMTPSEGRIRTDSAKMNRRLSGSLFMSA
jgi:hypothetical protein